MRTTSLAMQPYTTEIMQECADSIRTDHDLSLQPYCTAVSFVNIY